LDYGSEDNELVYVVKVKSDVKPNPPAKYVFHIREKDAAILRLDYTVGEPGNPMLQNTNSGHQLAAVEACIILFRERQGKFYPHYYQVEVDYAWHKDNQLVAQGVEKNEAIVQEIGVQQQKLLPMSGNKEDLPVAEYDSTFWKEYLLKDQIPLNAKVLADLEGVYNTPIEEQFAASSQRWTPRKTKQFYKELEANPPQPSLSGNVDFTLKGHTDAKFISVAGEFNSWNPFRYFLKKGEDGWSGKIQLPPGKYTYKFIVDGKWITDPGNTREENGESRSELVVR
jgi:hypothetical protein